MYSTVENPYSDRRIGIINLLENPRTLRLTSLSGLGTGDGDAPSGMVGVANGKVLVTTFGGRVVEVDPGASTQRIRTDIPSGAVGSVFVGSSNGTVELGKLGPDYLRYETGSDQFRVFTATTPDERQPSLDADGTHVAVGPRLYDGSMGFLRQAEYAGDNSSNVLSFLSLDGTYLYQVTTYTVGTVPYSLLLKNRVSDGKIVGGAHLPLRISRLRASNDGSFVVGVGIGARFMVLDMR